LSPTTRRARPQRIPSRINTYIIHSTPVFLSPFLKNAHIETYRQLSCVHRVDDIRWLRGERWLELSW
jgi:hypothetical protein